MDRSHCGPAEHARRGGASVTVNLATAKEPQTGNIVQARDLVKSFGKTSALRGASLTVWRGEIVAVMGPSGSGKSTLLHCLAGILVPEQGEVCFAGQRLDDLSDDRRSALRRDRFGFVFQSGQLVPARG
jgi:putative ABC transport system ATP-binding protein